jgi:hypothetical protein
MGLRQDHGPKGQGPKGQGPVDHGPETQRSAAWSLWVDLDQTGAVVAEGLERTWVKTALRLSYGDADELIDLAPPQERDLLCMKSLLERRRHWREQRGALNLEDPEGRIRCRGDEAQLEISEPSPSRQMVAEAMILVGALMAERGQRLGLALPFRTQIPGELPTDAELESLPPGPVRHSAIKRGLSRGHLGVTPGPHFSLALDAYVQATSPIRRYGDLVTQRQFEALRHGNDPLDEASLAGLLGVPEEVHLHDYAWFCPRVTLLGPERRYCGEPEDARECDACVADAGSVIEEALPTAALRARSAAKGRRCEGSIAARVANAHARHGAKLILNIPVLNSF